MTARQKAYFRKPRTMKEIYENLFNGDTWAANNFQNENFHNNNLKTIIDKNDVFKTIKIVNFNYQPKTV